MGVVSIIPFNILQESKMLLFWLHIWRMEGGCMIRHKQAFFFFFVYSALKPHPVLSIEKTDYGWYNFCYLVASSLLQIHIWETYFHVHNHDWYYSLISCFKKQSSMKIWEIFTSRLFKSTIKIAVLGNPLNVIHFLFSVLFWGSAAGRAGLSLCISVV